MRGILTAAVLLLALSGCATTDAVAEGVPTPDADAAATSTSDPSPTPEVIALDPAHFTTQVPRVEDGEDAPLRDGVDFDSADGNVRCAIWSDFTTERELYAGCRPQDADYQTPGRVPDVDCSGGELRADRPAQEVCDGGARFASELGAPIGPVGVIRPGESLSFAGITCTAPDETSVECVRASDGAGFAVGRASYRYF